MQNFAKLSVNFSHSLNIGMFKRGNLQPPPTVNFKRLLLR